MPRHRACRPLQTSSDAPRIFASGASDLQAIGDYIAQDSPANALRFVQRLRDQCQKIAGAPLAYVARPELRNGLRSCAYARYIIFFTPGSDLVRIERILHSAMDVQAVFDPGVP